MKILVCISQVPDTTAKIAFKDNGTVFNTEGVQFIMNPYDEWYALVRALEIKESQGGSVTVINVGLAENETIIRKALAIGADDAIRVDANSNSALFIAKQIAEVAKSEQYDLIFTGKETINFNRSEVGAMLAEYLDLPYISYATHMDLQGNTATVVREIEGGSETLELETPFVLSAAKGLAEQRIPNMKGIMMAKKKPLNVVAPIGFDDFSSPVKYDLPLSKAGVKLIDADNM
ncbi:MAG: electron transfer flavoprotein subunit beta/FixA family protein, partial [Saprospiraceae bacterium]|nr:electron transfer flavoprotein subunit beta/FixA family protein [Saprospiraceae bacterium]